MGGHKATNLLGQLIVLGGTEEPTVGHGLEYVELRIDPAGTQLPVHPNGVGQKQVSGSSLKERRRERGGEIAEQWRKIGVSEIVFTRIQSDGVSKADKLHMPRHFQFSAHRALAARPYWVCRISGPNQNGRKKEGDAHDR
jgi:hypothetical protein